MTSVAVLGAGMAGFGASHRLHELGVSCVIYEKKLHYGGHTASSTYPGGFTFDEGPHVSFTKDKRIQQLLAESVRGEFETAGYNVNNYWRGHWIKHPAHCNLYGLPPDLIVEIIRDFTKIQGSDHAPIANYEDWLLANYGEKFARTFPMEYTLKYHTVDARNMSTDWLGPRMYRPTLEEVLYGALTPATPNVHYVTEFRYPRRNGFVSFLNMFAAESEMRLGMEVTLIDPGDKTLTFSDGNVLPYGALVSSIPLPELIPMIKGAPVEVRRAAETLACSSCVVVNIGVDRANLSQSHITYFYDHDIIFTRLSFPHMMSMNNVPEGAGSIQAEVYFSRKYRPLRLTPQECIEPVVADLRKVGVLHEDDRILMTDSILIPYANVIFDLDRPSALSVVQGYLDELGISCCGRYGNWAYLWTDDAFKSGEEAAQKVLEGSGKTHSRRPLL